MDFQKLIPGFWRSNVKVTTEEELIYLGSETLKSLQRNWIREIIKTAEDAKCPECADELDELLTKICEAGKYVSLIAEAIEQAERKPCLAERRPVKWFKFGDEVICFVSHYARNVLKKGVFVTGKVINDNVYQRFVSVHAEEPVCTGATRSEHEFNLSLQRPEVMHKWEYEYLKTHPDYMKIWAEASAYWRNFDPDEMIEAFTAK